MARGAGATLPLEMTKWYDTNYHYLVPEIGPGTDFALRADKPLGELADAPGTRPVLVGPVSLLTLAKGAERGVRPLDRLEPLLDVYAELLEALHRAGATEVQIDEPCLVGDVGEDLLVAVERSWDRLAAASPGLELALITYFGGLGGALERVLRLPADEFHLDLVRAPEQLEPALAAVGGEARLSLGVIDGRNVWRSDLEAIIDRVEPALDRLGAERLRLAPSCSLLHVPYSAERERRLDPELRSWLAFAAEKLEELSRLKAALAAGAAERESLLEPSRRALAARRRSERVADPEVASASGRTRGDERRRALTGGRARRQAGGAARPAAAADDDDRFAAADAGDPGGTARGCSTAR